MFFGEPKMSETRTPLGSLGSDMNVGGPDYLRRRVGPERTPIERHTTRMYARREEAWRPLNKYRVAAFLRLFIMCFVETENGLQLHPITYKMLKRALITRIIPFIHKRLVFTMDDTYWPMTMEHFEELDAYLVEYLPRVRAAPEWDMIRYFFNEVKKQRQQEQREQQEAQRELTEEEAGERNYQQYRQTEEYYRDRDIC